MRHCPWTTGRLHDRSELANRVVEAFRARVGNREIDMQIRNFRMALAYVLAPLDRARHLAGIDVVKDQMSRRTGIQRPKISKRFRLLIGLFEPSRSREVVRVIMAREHTLRIEL